MEIINPFFGKKKKQNTVRVIRPRVETAPPIDTFGIEEEERPSVPAGMWEKCGNCNQIVYADDLQDNLKVCPHCGYHFRLSAWQRILMSVDDESVEEFSENMRGGNPLGFPGYPEKLKTARSYTGLNDAVITAKATIKGQPCVVCAMDSGFMMASMGEAVGEKVCIAVENAIKWKLPLIIFTASGGARMQEGIVALMQMAKVSAAVGRLHDAGLLYVVVLTDPTTGGVTASFAMLGDITLAEPNALIGFAGRRVIEQTTRTTLPEHFQRSEFLLERGFVDRIVERKNMLMTLAQILALHNGKKLATEEA